MPCYFKFIWYNPFYEQVLFVPQDLHVLWPHSFVFSDAWPLVADHWSGYVRPGRVY